MMDRELLIRVLSNPGESGGTPAYDPVTAARIAEDCLAIFSHEMNDVARAIRTAVVQEEPGEDLLYVPMPRFDVPMSDDEDATTEAIQLQTQWCTPLNDDAF